MKSKVFVATAICGTVFVAFLIYDLSRPKVKTASQAIEEVEKNAQEPTVTDPQQEKKKYPDKNLLSREKSPY